jgi:outer membrane protein assembly factor BamA
MLAYVLCLLVNLFPGKKPDVEKSASEPFIIIHAFRIEGNHKTKPSLIIRELDFAPGDTLPATQIADILLRNRNKIFNTNLFITVDLLLEPSPKGNIELLIKVTEQWYVFPMIIFELADRNFNEWWFERGRDLHRTNYGFKIAHKNFRGRGEDLRATAQFGFTKRFELEYTIRYLDKAQKFGLGFATSYSTNNSVAYRTEDNKLTYLSLESRLRERFNTSVRLTHRNQFYTFHRLEAKYHYNTIADTIAQLNPAYYGSRRTNQKYLYLSYQFSYDRRDIVAYPLRGKYFAAELYRCGILPGDNINLTGLTTAFSLYRAINKTYFWSVGFRGKISTPTRQPYANYRSLGYGFDYLRGYEYYVIDGRHFALSKLTFKRKLFSIQASLPNLIPIKQFQTIPIAMYLKVFGDTGYVDDRLSNPETSRLANTWLYSGGIGFDLVTFYNTVLRLDYSINKAGEKGFFLHFEKDM